MPVRVLWRQVLGAAPAEGGEALSGVECEGISFCTGVGFIWALGGQLFVVLMLIQFRCEPKRKLT